MGCGVSELWKFYGSYLTGKPATRTAGKDYLNYPPRPGYFSTRLPSTGSGLERFGPELTAEGLVEQNSQKSSIPDALFP